MGRRKKREVLPRKPGTWDTGISYTDAIDKILKFIKEKRKELREQHSKLKEEQLAKAIVLLIQLANASRIGEAIEAAKKFANGDKEVYVRVEKRKEDAKRLMILPDEIKEGDLEVLRKHVDKLYTEVMCNFARRHFGINTHSLRYATSTHWVADKGVAPEIVARIQGRKDAKSLYTYMQMSKAEDVLRMVTAK